jgi:hypothetical protein
LLPRNHDWEAYGKHQNGQLDYPTLIALRRAMRASEPTGNPLLDAKARCRRAYDQARQADPRSAVLYQCWFAETLLWPMLFSRGANLS